jgi:hypothetical protein
LKLLLVETQIPRWSVLALGAIILIQTLIYSSYSGLHSSRNKTAMLLARC